MKKPAFKKLGLATETIRNLTVAELGSVVGGFNNTIVVTTTKSIASACVPPLTTSGAIDTAANQPG